MLYAVKQLHSYKLRETNGDIGDIREVYFDDQQWQVRYFVVETGMWLFGRKVLISPAAVSGIDIANKVIYVYLTREQVKNSPDIRTDEPISIQIEERLSQYYGWPGYFGGGYSINPGLSYPFGLEPMAPFSDRLLAESKVENDTRAAIEDKLSHESHLRSSRMVTGYQVAAEDGDIGYVEDFIIDDVNWAIRYYAVDAGAWIPNFKVLLATTWTKRISWEDIRVYLNLQKDIIANSPPYDPSQPVTREYETRLFASFKRPGYWEAAPSQPRPVTQLN